MFKIRIRNLILGLSILALMTVSCNVMPGAGKVTLKNETDSVSYALGYLLASNLMNNMSSQLDTIYGKSLAKALVKSEVSDHLKKRYENDFDSLDYDVFKSAFVIQMAYGKSYFKKNTASGYLRSVNRKVSDRKAMQPGKPAYENKLKGDSLLTVNGKREGVITTESGLQYEIINEGSGVKPVSGDRVEVVYRSTLIDGTEYDSSSKKGKETASLSVNHLVKGWKEGMKLMSVGSKYRFYISGNLAYGLKGYRNKVGPMETIIIEVELLDVIKRKDKQKK
jgi:FKBP-type peptidyl-prolyl cis-trans isomerase